MKSESDDVTEPFQCGGTWRSDLGSPPGRRDGHFINLMVDGGGNIRGRHRTDAGVEKEIRRGTCQWPDSDPRHMTLVREEDGVVYEYSGDIRRISAGRWEANGFRRVIAHLVDGEEVAEAAKAGVRPPEDEQWVATRPPT